MMFQRNISRPSSGLKGKPRKKLAQLAAGFMPHLLFDSEDGGNMFFQNICLSL
jgi:hypothetical protein